MVPNATGIFESKLKFRELTNEEKKINASILGVIQGEHFCPNGFSRNGRFYPENEEHGRLWSKQLANEALQERIRNKTVYGTIGHNLEIGEKELREGLASHFTTNHEIRETGNPDKPFEGYAESYILNTPAGRCLKTYFEAGCNLYTSTRADGTYIEGKTVKTPEGKEVPVLNPDTFKYERNDFIINPGFLEANPKLKEGLNEETLMSINEAFEQEGVDFKEGEKIVEQEKDFTDDNKIKKVSEPNSPKGVPSANKGDTGSKAAIDSKDKSKELSDKDSQTLDDVEKKGSSEELIDDLLKKVEELESTIEKYSNIPEDVNTKLETLKKYEELGLVERIAETIEAYDDLVVTCGTVEEIQETFAKIKKFSLEFGDRDQISEYISISKEEIKNLKTKLESFEKLGITEEFVKEFESVEQVKEVLSSMTEFINKHNDLSKVRESIEQLNSFVEKYGKLEDIEKDIEEFKLAKLENRAHKLSENTGLDYDKILNHMKQGMSEKEIVEIYSKIKTSAYDRYIFTKDEEMKDEKVSSYKDNPNESLLGCAIRKFNS